MKTQNIYQYTLLAALLVAGFSFSGCRKMQNAERVFFEFEMHFTVTPPADTIKVGDTLLLTADYSDTLYEALRGERIPMECFRWNMMMVTWELKYPDTTISWQPGANNAFTFLFAPGNGEVTSAQFANVRQVCQNGRYKFELRLVAKRPGVFSFWVQDQMSDFIKLPERLAPSTPELRRIPLVRLNRYIINEGRTNFYIYKQHVKRLLPNEHWPEAEEMSIYTFIVR